MRHPLQVKAGRVLELTRVLRAERGVADGEVLGNMVPTSRPQLTRCRRYAPRFVARRGRSPMRKRAVFWKAEQARRVHD